MTGYHYEPHAILNISNKTFYCSENGYTRLCEKGKIDSDMKQVMGLLYRYRLLTKDMIACFLPDADKLQDHLDKLVDYSLIVRQFYEYRIEDEKERTSIFYSMGECVPDEIRKMCGFQSMFSWNTSLSIEDAMAILAFNHFHIALVESVPSRHLQAQTEYSVSGIVADGRYRLKSSRYYMGYSHMMAFSVRDFSGQNNSIVEKVQKITDYYTLHPQKGKKPWFILICENKIQCANINRRFAVAERIEKENLYYVLDDDIRVGKSPLENLKQFRFQGNEESVISQKYMIKDWY